ncbi:hypothetical protein [Nocardioides ferulae]|uniref:hypothetical protein n=1 Tax=Nocardioides ferulae TaxID=2340821 RepID=UPI000EAEA5A9|nr:hypothetical protein [Nocardioides ferulae]
MNVWVLLVAVVLVGAVLVSTVVLLVRDESPGDPSYALMAAAEVALLVQAAWGITALVRTDRDVSAVIFVGYLAAVVVALPLGAFWSLAERNRAGTAVLLVAAATVLALELRLDAIWDGAGA